MFSLCCMVVFHGISVGMVVFHGISVSDGLGMVWLRVVSPRKELIMA